MNNEKEGERKSQTFRLIHIDSHRLPRKNYLYIYSTFLSSILQSPAQNIAKVFCLGRSKGKSLGYNTYTQAAHRIYKKFQIFSGAAHLFFICSWMVAQSATLALGALATNAH